MRVKFRHIALGALLLVFGLAEARASCPLVNTYPFVAGCPLPAAAVNAALAARPTLGAAVSGHLIAGNGAMAQRDSGIATYNGLVGLTGGGFNQSIATTSAFSYTSLPSVSGFATPTYGYNLLHVVNASAGPPNSYHQNGLGVVYETGGAVVQGLQEAAFFMAHLRSPTSVSEVSPQISGVGIATVLDAGQGGSDGTPRGQAWGAYIAVISTANSTGTWATLTGLEVNNYLYAGAHVNARMGLLIDGFSETQHGLNADCQLCLAGGGASDVGWNVGISFSNITGYYPLTAGGILMQATSGQTIGTGFDIEATITGNVFQYKADTGSYDFFVNSGGNLFAKSMTAVDPTRANSIALAAAATGNNPTLTCGGTDATVGCGINTKNAGGLTVNGGNGTLLVVLGSASAVVNYPSLAPATTGSAVIYSAAGGDATISAILQPKGASGSTLTLAGVGGATLTNLPSGAGAGGLNVCADSSGAIYRKAACP